MCWETSAEEKVIRRLIVQGRFCGEKNSHAFTKAAIGGGVMEVLANVSN